MSPISTVSRRLHGPLGSFDVDLLLDGTAVIDPRQNGTNPQMVLTYGGPLLDPGCAGITVMNGTCQNTSVVGNDLIIDMTYNENACVEVTVGENTLRVLTHTGNINADDEVNVIDLQDVKNHVFQPVDAATCVYDVNCDGEINVIDLQQTKNNVFTPMPTCD
jgi:hypothetical protein